MQLYQEGYEVSPHFPHTELICGLSRSLLPILEVLETNNIQCTYFMISFMSSFQDIQLKMSMQLPFLQVIFSTSVR